MAVGTLRQPELGEDDQLHLALGAEDVDWSVLPEEVRPVVGIVREAVEDAMGVRVLVEVTPMRSRGVIWRDDGVGRMVESHLPVWSVLEGVEDFLHRVLGVVGLGVFDLLTLSFGYPSCASSRDADNAEL